MGNALFGKMMGMDPEDLLSEEEINKHLSDAFHKFDEDNSGQLGQWEFMQAWFFLGLKGTEEEIHDAFKVIFFFEIIGLIEFFGPQLVLRFLKIQKDVFFL